jgi:hypothetical protein
MLLKIKNIAITNDYLIINKKKRYKWKDIELKLSDYQEVSYANHYAHNATSIAVFQNDTVVEEILCNIDAVELFEIDSNDLFNLLQAVQTKQKIDIIEYTKLVEKQKASHKKALKCLLILLSIVLLPITLIVIFIKS